MAKNTFSYIAPIREFNFQIDKWNQFDINELIDEKYKIAIRLFSYHDDIEPIDADSFSVSDKSSLNFYPYAFYFRCKPDQVEQRKLLINLILLAFRIFKKANCISKYILCLRDTHFSIKYNESWKVADVGSKSGINLDKIDIQDVVEGYKKLRSFYSINNRTKHAVQFLYLAYTSYHWMQAFVLFMIALETLLSPTDEIQITKTIIGRTRKLIGNPKICSKKIIDDLYQLRSDITHGRILADLSFRDHIKEVSRLQIIVLKAFEIILSKNYKKIYKTEQTKELFSQKLDHSKIH